MSRKGGNWCSAAGCRSDFKSTNKSFFKFLRDPARWLIWVYSCECNDLLQKGPTHSNKNCRLCSDHFEKRMYRNDLRMILMPDAIPTLRMCGLLDDALTPQLEQQASALPNDPSVESLSDPLVDQTPFLFIEVETPPEISSETQRKRKLQSELTETQNKVARLTDQSRERSDTVSEMTLDDFSNACQKFLPQNFSLIAQQQARLHGMKDISDMN